MFILVNSRTVRHCTRNVSKPAACTELPVLVPSAFTSVNELFCECCPVLSCHPSVLWHCWLGHLTRKIVSEMTYNVSSGTLNTTIPYHPVLRSTNVWLYVQASTRHDSQLSAHAKKNVINLNRNKNVGITQLGNREGGALKPKTTPPRYREYVRYAARHRHRHRHWTSSNWWNYETRHSRHWTHWLLDAHATLRLIHTHVSNIHTDSSTNDAFYFQCTTCLITQPQQTMIE